MAQCTNHPDRPAAATCQACGRPFCDECFAPPDGSESRLCLDCAVRDTATRLADGRPRHTPAAGTPPGRASAGRWLIPLLVLLLLVEVIAYLGLRASAGSAPALDSPEAAEAADFGDLLMVQEMVRDRWESSGVLPDLMELAAQLPEDLAERVRAGDLRLEPADSGFVLSIRTATGNELAVNQDGEQMGVEGGGS